MAANPIVVGLRKRFGEVTALVAVPRTVRDRRIGPNPGPDHQPHVVPVRFRYNPETDTIDIGGHQFAKRAWGSGRDARAGRSQTPNSGHPTDAAATRR